jgi:hypothetical protein
MADLTVDMLDKIIHNLPRNYELTIGYVEQDETRTITKVNLISVGEDGIMFVTDPLL